MNSLAKAILAACFLLPQLLLGQREGTEEAKFVMTARLRKVLLAPNSPYRNLTHLARSYKPRALVHRKIALNDLKGIEDRIQRWSKDGISRDDLRYIINRVWSLGWYVVSHKGIDVLRHEHAVKVIMQIGAHEPSVLSDCSSLIVQTRKSTWANMKPQLQALIQVAMDYVKAGKSMPPAFQSLVPLLPLTVSQKKKLLSAKLNWAEHHRARLGDPKAKRYCIEVFRNSKDFGVMKTNAERLAYIGGHDCAIELIKALNSPVMKQPTTIDKISIRPYIVKALGDIHPKNDLLYIQSRRLLQGDSERQFGGHDEVVKFLHAVVLWAKKTYGISPVDKFDAKAIIWSRPPP